jgi:ribosomal protein S18 acetylase RimI-like enzyme
MTALAGQMLNRTRLGVDAVLRRYRSGMLADPPMPAGASARPADLTPADVRWLSWHEARSHGLVGREVRNLDDAYLLHDPTDREPFWNRLVGIDWPRPTGAFDRRLTEALALFAGLDRIPHVWPTPGFDEPPDLVDRLVAHGFEDHGGGLFMVLDPKRFGGPATARPETDLRLGRITVERFHRLIGTEAEKAARAIAQVLIASFEVGPERRVAIELETVQGLALDVYHVILARVDGEPAAVTRRTTFAGASYLSSIGTDPRHRGRGLGRLVTSIAVADAIAAGSRWTYLGVFEENDVAQRLYDSIGFDAVGGVNPDLLLRG